MDIEEVMTMESLEKSAARRRTLSNSSTTSTPSSGSSRTPSSGPCTGAKHSNGQKSTALKGSSKKHRSHASSMKIEDDDGVDECDETTPFTTSSMMEDVSKQPQDRVQPEATLSLSLPLMSGRESQHTCLSHTQTSDLKNSQAASSASMETTDPTHDSMKCGRVGRTKNPELDVERTMHSICLTEGKCLDTTMTSLDECSEQTRTPIYALAASSPTSPFPPPSYSAASTGDDKRADSFPLDVADQSKRQTFNKQQLVTLINTPAPEFLHVRIPAEIETDPHPAITVIAIDPESGSSLYTPKPTSFVYPSFTPVGMSTTNKPTVLDSTASSGEKASTTKSGLRTVCGACGGVMPPPGTAIHLEGVGSISGSGVVGIGGSVGLTPAKAILLTSRANHQSMLISKEDSDGAVGDSKAVDAVGEEGHSAEATIPASSTSTSLQTSTGTPANVDICRICHCEGEAPGAPLIAPCYCTGSLRWVHQSCLQQWIKSSETRKCELCKFEFIMETKIKPFQKWEKLQMTTVERRKIMCSVTFHAIAITCVIWSLYVLIDRTTDEVKKGNLEWPFWTKLIVVAIGFIGGLVFMYVQFKMYIALCRRWRAFNRVIYVQDIPDALLTSSKEKLKASGLLTSSKADRTGRGSSVSGSASASKEESPEAANRRQEQQQQQQPTPEASPVQHQREFQEIPV